MRRRKYEIRVFKCPECGMTNYAAKSVGRMSGRGHVKDLYCPTCKKITKQVQEGVK